MDSQKTSDLTHRAVEVLSRLNDIGAINLKVLVEKSAEINKIIKGSSGGASLDDDDAIYRICYRFYIRLGPASDIDIVSVANQMRSLGFELVPTRQQTGIQN